MRWSFSIGKCFGIPVRVHATFFLLLALVAFVAYRPDAGGAMTVWPMALVLAIFACILGHELAHSLVARRFGVEVDSITLLPIGGMASITGLPRKAWQEVVIAVAGPAFSLAVAGVVYVVLRLAGESFDPRNVFADRALKVSTAWGALAALGPINVVIAVVNLFPAFPLDGGRVLRGVLALKLPLVKATRIAASIGETAAVFLILYGLMSGNIWLIVIGIFLLMGALSEEQSVEIDAVFEDMKVKRVMLTEFERTDEGTRMLDVVDTICRTGQAAIPVLDDGGHYLGLVDITSLGQAIREHGTRGKVADALRQDDTELDPEDEVAGAFETMKQKHFDGMAVLEDGLLVGVLLQEHVGRLFRLNRAIQEAPPPRPMIAPGQSDRS